jgi:hypothetical protein
MNDQFTLPIEDLFEDERRIRKAKAQEEIKRRERHMKVVLSIPEGRAIIYWIIEQGGFFRPSYNGKSLDLAYLAGVKEVPSKVLRVGLSVNPKLFAQFIEDRLTKEKDNE